MSTSVRKQAPRLPKPAARYWKGKAPKGIDSSGVNEDSDEEEQEEIPHEAGDVSLSGDIALDSLEDGENDLNIEQSLHVPKRSLNIALKDVSISRDGKVTVAGREESGRTVAEAESDASDEEEEEEEDAAAKVGQDESEEESSEEESEDEQPTPMFQPVFIPKTSRVTVAEREAMAQDTEAAAKQKELEAEERKKQSHEMVAESIRRELAEKEKEENVPDINDTDGLDPEAEFEAWRLRELGRIKRDKEEEVRREEERAEVERRRALPEEQRLREDLEHAESSRADKPKGQQKFLQKYWHKGAFHQDEEILQRHDFTEATQSTMDISLLPKVMQVKNFGKRGRTKYTHLVDQDTTQGSGGFGGVGSVQSGGTSTASGACFLCGGPHMKKDCPQNQDIPPGQRPGTGANGVGLDSRTNRGKWDERRDEDDRRASWRDRDYRDDQRSGPTTDHATDRYPRSPRRERSRDVVRRRSRSRSGTPDRDMRRTDDKRRRLD